ncbi:unnamed protein product, partial [Ectocarpus sp. 8 AP-2014]
SGRRTRFLCWSFWRSWWLCSFAWQEGSFFCFFGYPFGILMTPAQRRHTPTKLEQRTRHGWLLCCCRCLRWTEGGCMQCWVCLRLFLALNCDSFLRLASMI